MYQHISFNEEEHSYTNVVTKQRYTSVTTLIGRYESGFDGDYWSIYKGYQDYLGFEDDNNQAFKDMMKRNGIDYRNKSKANLIAVIRKSGLRDVDVLKPYATARLLAWEYSKDKACARGTAYHKEREDEAYKDGFMVFENKQYGTSYSYALDLAQLTDGAYAELLVYLHRAKLSGQADKVNVETIKGVRYVDIDDWKTNKKITFENSFDKYKAPISHLEETKYNKHALQLSMYGYILEQHGYTVRNIRFTHAILNEQNKEIHREYYSLPYLRRECELLIADSLLQAA